MRPKAIPVIAVFLGAGLCAAGVSLLLGFWFLPLLFVADGLVLLAFLGVACALCRRLAWTPAALNRRRYWEAAALLAIGYPAAELFGTLLALFCEGALLLLTSTKWHAAHEPQLWIGLLAFWGPAGAAVAVNIAVMVITDWWDRRLLFLLIGAGVVTTLVALRVYLPNYAAKEGFAARYRELVLFGVLLPLGNALYSVLAGYGLIRRPPARPVRSSGLQTTPNVIS